MALNQGIRDPKPKVSNIKGTNLKSLNTRRPNLYNLRWLSALNPKPLNLKRFVIEIVRIGSMLKVLGNF